jgi:hypothetical protein
MSANMLGNGAHSIRSINVRANLLAEWTTDQVRFKAQATRYCAAIVGLAITMAVCVPILEGKRTALVPAFKVSEQSLAELRSSLDQAERARKQVEPSLATEEISSETTKNFDRLMGEMYAVLNSSNPGLVFSSTKAEVQAATISIDCKADAENFEVAEAFSQRAGSTPNKLSTMSSIRPGGLFKDGVNFDYLKKVSLQ